MFREPATIGAIFLTVLVLGSQIVDSERISSFVTESPLVTVAAALGIGALIDYLGGALHGLFASGVPSRRIVRGLPEFQDMWKHSRRDRQHGIAVGFGREDFYKSVADFHFRRNAPGPLVEHVAQLRAGSRQAFLISWTITLAIIVLVALDESSGIEVVLGGGFLLVLIAGAITTRTLRGEMEAVILEEQFLRETVLIVEPPPSEWGQRVPMALPAIGYVGAFRWLWRLWRARRAIERQRQRKAARRHTS